MAILARDVMRTDVISVQPSTPVPQLEDTLVGRRISGAPVIQDGHLLGIVSRSDIVRYFSIHRSLSTMLGKQAESTSAREHKADPQLTVKDIMAETVVVVGPDEPIDDVARLMYERHVHRVLVTEGDSVLGIISALDLAQLIAEKKLIAGEAG